MGLLSIFLWRYSIIHVYLTAVRLSNLQDATARCADKCTRRHVDICWASLVAVEALLVRR